MMGLQNHGDLESPKALAFGLDVDIFSTQIENLPPNNLFNEPSLHKEFLGDQSNLKNQDMQFSRQFNNHLAQNYLVKSHAPNLHD
jgi:hypothetical protein